MNKRNSFLVLLMFVSVLGYGGRPLRYIGFAMNNYVAAKPVTGFPKMFYSQFHPGVTVSTGFNWKERVNYSWMQSFKASFFSHRFIQHSFSIYSEFGYRRKAGKWGYSAALGAGYLHMFPGAQQFKQNDQGEWQSVKITSRPQGLISLSLGIDRSVGQKGWKVFVRYQNMLQTPFIPGYVPLLPYNVLHAGFTMPLKRKERVL